MKPSTLRLNATLRLTTALLAFGLTVGHALAQPYVADGGFGRPWRVAGPGVAPAIAVASDQNDLGSDTLVVWADGNGVWASELHNPAADDRPAGEPRNVSGPGSIRSVAATVAGAEPAVAWLQRDLRTGNTLHYLNWRGRDHLLFEAGQETPLQLGSRNGTPWVLANRRFGGEAHLQLFGFDDDGEPAAPLSIYRTTLSVRGVAAAAAGGANGGPAWIGWLEGETTSGLLGPDAEWSAYLLSLNPDGTPSGDPLELGLARVLDERQRVVLGPASAAPSAGSEATPAVRALWLGVDGTLQLTTVAPPVAGSADGPAPGGVAAGPGTSLVATTVDLGESGRPVALTPDYAYWHSEEFIRRTTLDPDPDREPDTTTAPATVRAPISVAWSPVFIAAAELAVAGPPGAGLTSIAWYGRRQGGAVEVYATDDSVAFSPTLVDRLAAVMGWSPWSPWQEGLGQFLTSVLVGVLAVMALSPLLFVFSLLFARFDITRQRPLGAGVALGVAVPLAVGVFIGLRFPASGLTQLGERGVLVAMVTLALGAAGALLVNRKADREPQLGLLITSCTVVLLAVVAWAFIEYRTWAPVVGLG